MPFKARAATNNCFSMCYTMLDYSGKGFYSLLIKWLSAYMYAKTYKYAENYYMSRR